MCVRGWRLPSASTWSRLMTRQLEPVGASGSRPLVLPHTIYRGGGGSRGACRARAQSCGPKGAGVGILGFAGPGFRAVVGQICEGLGIQGWGGSGL